MATMTIARPAISSPLAQSAQGTSSASVRPAAPKRNPSFPMSRPLRPFPSVANVMKPLATSKPIKIIEPSKNQRHTFVLDLTQAEFSRQD